MVHNIYPFYPCKAIYQYITLLLNNNSIDNAEEGILHVIFIYDLPRFVTKTTLTEHANLL